MKSAKKTRSTVKSTNPRPLSVARRAALYGQMARMLDAGIPITRVLDHLQEQGGDRMAGPMAAARGDLDRGASLEQALTSAPSLFPSDVVPLLAAADQTGGLSAALGARASALELRLEVHRQLVRAAVLPSVLLVLVFLLPRLHLLFTGGVEAYLRGAVLPMVVAVAVVAAVVWGVLSGLPRVLGPQTTARLLTALPVASGLLDLAARVRVCDQLAAGLRAGLGIGPCVELAARTAGTPRLSQRLRQAAEFVDGGETLHRAMQRAELGDRDLLLSVSTGEQAGSLPQSLSHQARLYQTTLSHRVNLAVQGVAIVVLLSTYLFATAKVVSEFQSVLGGAGSQIQRLLDEVDGAAGGAGKVQHLLKELKPGGGAGKLNLKPLLDHALDPANINKLPEDIQRELE